MAQSKPGLDQRALGFTTVNLNSAVLNWPLAAIVLDTCASAASARPHWQLCRPNKTGQSCAVLLLCKPNLAGAGAFLGGAKEGMRAFLGRGWTGQRHSGPGRGDRSGMLP